jgi:hypothetical protein
MWTNSDVAGASQQDIWNTAAGISGLALTVVAVGTFLYLVKPYLFSDRTNPFWEALLAPVLLAFQWLGVILPRRGPWGRYVYAPRHLVTT